MKAVILAAGYGTRLYPLTKDKPKALLPVGEKTILGHLYDKLDASTGLDQVTLVTNDKFAGQFADWVAQTTLPIPTQVLSDGTTSEDNRLGSIGDLVFAIEHAGINDDLLVLGSDNLLKDKLDAFMRYAQSQDRVTVGTYELPTLDLACKYGVLAVDDTQRVMDFLEKPEKPPSKLISTAIYFFPRETLRLVLQYASSQQSIDTLGSFIAWLIEQVPVMAHVFDGPWFDIGDLTSYEHAQRTFVAA